MYTNKEFQNNALFWQKVDTLYLSSSFELTRKKGSLHPQYPNLQYPCDYGYLKTLEDENEDLIACFIGSNRKEVNAIIVCADILKKDLEVKILIGVSEEEEETILQFLNQTEFQKSIIIHRGLEVPSWAQFE